MKNKYIFIVLTLGLLFGLSCEKELLTRADYTDYAFAGIDEKGGNWKPILLLGASQIVIPAPKEVTSDEYKAELNNLKLSMSTLSSAQREEIAYWTNNPILRWNEIALDLASKYNLIPEPNADGSYPVPDAANPGKYPLFPYSHPPYTCRALAYLSVAQFDGLISAWNYKFKYNRKAPYEVDNSIVSAYAKTALPAYPADGAVVAAASRDILIAMFPLEKDYLIAKANENMACLTWAGVNVQSDLDAGAIIGAEVAKVALQRAGGDGMRKAQTPRAISDSIKTAALNRFGWQWDNQETPVRPVGLTPLFGKVRMWNVPTVEEVRPPEPPKPGSAEFNVAAQELKDITKNLTTEQRKIANWWSDGLNTYTPPGHWNRFAKDFLIKYKFNPLRSARTLAYMNMAIMDAGISCWDAKYYYHYPRPIQAIPGFKTILGTPNFPAYTSGHSTFSAAGAEVLSYIFPEEAQQCQAWAREAAESRIYGGIHYRFDAEAGLAQGKKVAVYAVNRAKKDGAE